MTFGADVATALLGVFGVLMLLHIVVGVSLSIDYEIFAILIAAAFLVLGLIGHVPRSESDVALPRSGRQNIIALLSLMFAGAILRLYALGDSSLWFDEAITINAAMSLLETARPQFPSGQPYYRGLPHTVLVALSMSVFGISEWAARLPSALLGIVAIPATYWLGKEVGNRRVGIVAAFIVTFLTWEIAWGRQARMYQQLQLFYVLALIGLARVDETRLTDRTTMALIAGGSIGAALTHTIGLILFPVAGVYVSVHLWRTQDGIPREIWALGGMVAVAAGWLEVRGGGLIGVTRTVLSTDIVHFGRYHAWVSTEFGVVYFLAVIGFGLSFRHRRHAALLALALIPPLWVLAFNTRLFAGRYVYFAVPIIAVYIGFVVDFGIERLHTVLASAQAGINGRVGLSVTDGVSRALAVVIPVGVVLVLITSSLTMVPQAAYGLGPNAPQPDFKSAYAYVDGESGPDDVLVAGWTAPAVYYHGTVDYWLVHNLTGAERSWTTEGGQEVYSGATPISNEAELRQTIACHESGWVVIDSIVEQRMSSGVGEVVAGLHEHDIDADGMRVFSWAGEEICMDGTGADSSGTQSSRLDNNFGAELAEQPWMIL